METPNYHLPRAHRRGRLWNSAQGVQRLRGVPATELAEAQNGGRHQEDAAEDLEMFVALRTSMDYDIYMCVCDI